MTTSRNTPTQTHPLYFLTLGMAFISGCAGLAHELIWTRRLMDLTGGDAESYARVFGCFFLGLAIGAVLGGWLASIKGNPWKLLAMTEASVVLFSLPILFLPYWTGWIWPWIGRAGILGWQGDFIKLLISIWIIIPPAIGMGCTLPILSASIHPKCSVSKNTSIALYAVNTLGGVAGIYLGGTLLLPGLGLFRSLFLVTAMNGIIALIAWMMGVLYPNEGKGGVMKQYTDASGMIAGLWSLWQRAKLRTPLFIAFLSGFLILAYEILALRMVMLVATLSLYGPAAVLACVILLVAVSSVAIMFIKNKDSVFLQRVVLIAGVAALFVALSPVIFMKLVQGGVVPSTAHSITAYWLTLMKLSFLCFGPGLFVAGMLFPLALKHAETTWDGKGMHPIAWLLAVNGIGGLLGAEFAYRLILPTTGIHVGMGWLGIFFALLSLAVSILCRKRSKRSIHLPLSLAFGCMVVCLTLFKLRGLPHINEFASFTIIELEVGREGTLATVEHPDIGRSLLVDNQYTLGSTKVRWDEERQTHLPLMLHPNPRDCAFIGLATGISAGAALAHSQVEKVDVIEISSLIPPMAREHFGEYNHNLLDSSRVHLAVQDGRTFIAAQRNAYDIVIGDLFLPWNPGVGRLYSREHFKSVKESLKQGGLFAQWLPLYQLTPGQLDIILRTFQTAFSRVHLFMGGFNSQTPVLGLVGFKDSDLDWTHVRARCSKGIETGEVLDPLMRHPEGLAMLYLGFQENSTQKEASINSLNNMLLELNAVRHRLVGNPADNYLYGTNWMTWVREWKAKDQHSTMNIEAPIKRLGLHGLNLLALNHGHVVGAKFKMPQHVMVSNQVPSNILQDSQADWPRWSGVSPNEKSSIIPW